MILVFLIAALFLAACDSPVQDPVGVIAPPTFASDIAPIIHQNCAPCHRPGEVAPFPLLSYTDVKKHAEQIAVVTADRFMPPWMPAAGYGTFSQERRLSQEQIDLLAAWARAGAPQGDSTQTPAPPQWTKGWQLGQPDLVVDMPLAYTLAPDGTDVFRNFVVPVGLRTRRYIRAVELRPGNNRIVHHAVIMVDATGAARLHEARDPEPGFAGMTFGEAQDPDGHFLGWTPGKRPYAGEKGLAWKLEPGTDLVLQFHMLPTGKSEKLQAKVGLYFADGPPTLVPAMLRLGRKDLDIPAGEKHYPVRDIYKLPVDVEVLTIYPHAHYLGKEMSVFATLPDGSKEWLIRIPEWDFFWQDDYRYAEPVHLPAGSVIEMQYVYDNSADNILNPFDPPQRIRYGLRSEDEMGDLTLQVLPKNPADLPTLRRDMARKWVDQEIDGYRVLLAAEPQNADYHHTLAGLYRRIGRTNDALEHFASALKTDPDFAEARINLGITLAADGRTNEALLHFRLAIEARPDYADAHFNLGAALYMIGDKAGGFKHLREASRLRPEMTKAIAKRIAQLEKTSGKN
jgi:hypothetical protein